VSRSNKRRKLDDSDAPVTQPPIKYGWYGQCEAGQLKMQIVTCDGGEHRDTRNPEIRLSPENVLKLDKSVYCSVRKSASFVMKHEDGTIFCLEKLHIVAPEHGFTAP